MTDPGPHSHGRQRTHKRARAKRLFGAKRLAGLINGALAPLGYRISRLEDRPRDRSLLDDPREAFVARNLGRPRFFKARFEHVVDNQAFGFGRGSWHPFVHALKTASGSEAEATDLLGNFYEQFTPRTAGQAIVGFEDCPKKFHALPPYMFYLTPWSADTPETLRRGVDEFVYRDNMQHGKALTLEKDGFPTYGPVSPAKLNVEASRLGKAFRALAAEGYVLDHGPCYFLLLRAGAEIRLVSAGGGTHRTAAAAALGMDFVPGCFMPGKVIFDVDDVEFWPNVKSGLWTPEQARKYVEHLFSYDARIWARQKGLV